MTDDTQLAGATPGDDTSGLIDLSLATRADRNAAEAQTIGLAYNKYVFEFGEEDGIKDNDNFIKRIKSELYSKIERNVNIEATIRPQDFNELLAPVEVDFIGKNGKIVAGQTLDFTKRHTI